jgi:hypothetical protein
MAEEALERIGRTSEILRSCPRIKVSLATSWGKPKI